MNEEADIALEEEMSNIEDDEAEELYKLCYPETPREDVVQLVQHRQQENVEQNPPPDYNQIEVGEMIDTPCPPPDPSHLKVLRDKFGHASFRAKQWKIIRSLMMDHADNCVVMSTGYGKSLCYQFPAVYLEGVSLVVSPLISLMQDQVQGLAVKGIQACYLGSAQEDGYGTKQRIYANEYRIVYVTPEFCASDDGKHVIAEMFNKCKVKVVAIDEAHCVSQWGHDFRKHYRELSNLRNLLPGVPTLAVTATATPKIRADICDNLKLRFPEVTVTGFDRPNLYLACDKKTKNVFDDLKKHMVHDEVTGLWRFEGPTIIYVPKRDLTEEICDTLKRQGVNCTFYHSQVPLRLRKQRHEDFSKDKIQCIVATIAFGMGIDKPDIRLVIHYGCPQTIESYYQEIGRAGRDSLRAHCHCYHGPEDHALNMYFITPRANSEMYAFAVGPFVQLLFSFRTDQLTLAEKYVDSLQCRRRFILAHFHDNGDTDETVVNKDCCDNCDRKLQKNVPREESLLVDGKYDFTDDVVALLKAFKLHNGRTGVVKPIKFLLGSRGNDVLPWLQNHALFGSGKHRDMTWWRLIARMMFAEGHLQETFNAGGPATSGSRYLKLTVIGQKGIDLMKSIDRDPGTRVMLAPSSDVYEMLQRKARKKRVEEMVSARQVKEAMRREEETRRKENSVPIKSVDTLKASGISSDSPAEQQLQADLYRELHQLRDQLACDAHCMQYMVCNDKALLELATMRPSTLALLKLVDGFTDVKVSKFGQALLDKIDFFCLRHSLPRDGGILTLLQAQAEAEGQTDLLFPNESEQATAPLSQAEVKPKLDTTTPMLAKSQEIVEEAAGSSIPLAGWKRSKGQPSSSKQREPDSPPPKKSKQRGIREFLTPSPEKRFSLSQEVKTEDSQEMVLTVTRDLNNLYHQLPAIESGACSMSRMQDLEGNSQETVLNESQPTGNMSFDEALSPAKPAEAALNRADNGTAERLGGSINVPQTDKNSNWPSNSEVDWGDDELLQSIDIEKFSPSKSAAKPSDWGDDEDFNIDARALRALESVSNAATSMQDASEVSCSQESRGSQDSQGSQGGVKKRKMPTWLTNPEAGKVMKRNMMANSLFKRH